MNTQKEKTKKKIIRKGVQYEQAPEKKQHSRGAIY